MGWMKSVLHPYNIYIIFRISREQVCRANIEAFSVAECIACHGTTRFIELTKEMMVWVVGYQVECVANQQGQVCTEQTRFYFNWPRRLLV